MEKSSTIGITMMYQFDYSLAGQCSKSLHLPSALQWLAGEPPRPQANLTCLAEVHLTPKLPLCWLPSRLHLVLYKKRKSGFSAWH